jgi:hypothetical protein
MPLIASSISRPAAGSEFVTSDVIVMLLPRSGISRGGRWSRR